jgi:hypothetical protein
MEAKDKYKKWVEENRIHCEYYPSDDCKSSGQAVFYCDDCRNIVCESHIYDTLELCANCLEEHKKECEKENHEDCRYDVCDEEHEILGQHCESCRDNYC